MIKVAAVQFSSRDEPTRNLDKALELASLAVDRGAQLIAFPELCTTPWFPSRMKQGSFDLAEEIPGPSTGRVSEFAAKNRVVMVLPLFEKAGKGKYYNSVAVIDADGSLCGVYRKAHVPNINGWHEKFYFLPGNKGFPVFDTQAGRIGVLLSWDIYFPEASRILALGGAQLVVVPTANAHASQERWEKMFAGNALANGLYFLRVNRVGREEKQVFYGKSFCMNPHGELDHRPAGSRDSVHITDISTEEIQQTRNEWAFFRDRREKLYDNVSKRMDDADSLGLPAGHYSGGIDRE
jgi:N-carbamoylputrescine amidase